MIGNRSGSRYTADGKRRSSMTHAKRAHTCLCGRVVMGNGYYMHLRNCDEAVRREILGMPAAEQKSATEKSAE